MMLKPEPLMNLQSADYLAVDCSVTAPYFAVAAGQ
jgi:hypothetical protein